jgi:hypothetical protein
MILFISQRGRDPASAHRSPGFGRLPAGQFLAPFQCPREVLLHRARGYIQPSRNLAVREAEYLSHYKHPPALRRQGGDDRAQRLESSVHVQFLIGGWPVIYDIQLVQIPHINHQPGRFPVQFREGDIAGNTEQE